jgi:putative transposase
MDIIWADGPLSIRRQCELLGVPRSTFYFTPKGESPENLMFMDIMDRYWMEHPYCGVLRLQDHLEDLGYAVNHKRVRRLMRLMGIEAIYPKRNLSSVGAAEYIMPYLLKGLDIDRPNKVWAIDITYIPMPHGFLYLIGVVDIYSRYVVGWTLTNTLEADPCVETVVTAIREYGAPEIINSDQGSQFTSALWKEAMQQAKVKVSMDGKGRAIDNIFIERIWRSVKYEYVYLNPEKDGLAFYHGLRKWFEWYNTKRKHQGKERRTPVSIYQMAV